MKVNWIPDVTIGRVMMDKGRGLEMQEVERELLLPQCPKCLKAPTYNEPVCPWCGVDLEYERSAD